MKWWRDNWIAVLFGTIAVGAICIDNQARADATMRIIERGLYEHKLLGVLNYPDVSTCRKHRAEFLYLGEILGTPLYVTCTPQEVD